MGVLMMKFRYLFLIVLLSFTRFISAAEYGHIHLAAPDTAVAAQWYVKHFGGTASGFGGDTSSIDRVAYGNIPVVFFQREPGEGSVGSGVDHIGFSMPDVAEKMQAIIADGGKSLGDLVSFAGMTIGFVEDPWGTKIELIDDSDLRGMHHIHLSSPDPETTLQWYSNMFGGESDKFKGVLDGLFYGNVWLLVARARGEIAPTMGRSMDHLGWNFDNLDEAAVMLKAKGINFTMEPRDYRGIRISFVDGPDGVRIELVQY